MAQMVISQYLANIDKITLKEKFCVKLYNTQKKKEQEHLKRWLILTKVLKEEKQSLPKCIIPVLPTFH